MTMLVLLRSFSQCIFFVIFLLYFLESAAQKVDSIVKDKHDINLINKALNDNSTFNISEQ